MRENRILTRYLFYCIYFSSVLIQIKVIVQGLWKGRDFSQNTLKSWGNVVGLKN